MDAAEKVREYLSSHTGHLTTAGRATFDGRRRQWSVPVLCKTSRGILVVGEFVLDEDLEFVQIPEREQMLRILQATKRRIPALVYADEKKLRDSGLRAVAV